MHHCFNKYTSCALQISCHLVAITDDEEERCRRRDEVCGVKLARFYSPTSSMERVTRSTTTSPLSTDISSVRPPLDCLLQTLPRRSGDPS